jgi:hypothetical protein
MESPVDVKGCKWQAADDSVIKKSTKDEKDTKEIVTFAEIKQPTNDEKNSINLSRFAGHGFCLVANRRNK